MEGLLSGATLARFTWGQRRACAPGETVVRVRPTLAGAGITRVADVTGLDRLGIPVVMVVRPNGRSLSVSQGKGVDGDSARASGVMEALENHCAERADLPIRRASFAELTVAGVAADPARLPLRQPARYTPAATLPWVRGMDLLSGRPAWVPWERVHVDYTVAETSETGIIAQDSNGLASGNTLAEAVLQGLLELVERDAAALAARRERLGDPAPLVDPLGAGDELVDELLGRCRHAGVTVEIRDLTSDIGIPVFHALIADTESSDALCSLRAVAGCGCHPDAGVALVRAITEAAQSRLTIISGAREDLAGEHYVAPVARPTPPDAHAGSPPRRLAVLPWLVRPTLEGDVGEVLDRLRARGVDQAVAVDLSPHDIDIAVVRVVVPDLEGFAGSPHYRPGRRALAVTA